MCQFWSFVLLNIFQSKLFNQSNPFGDMMMLIVFVIIMLMINSSKSSNYGSIRSNIDSFKVMDVVERCEQLEKEGRSICHMEVGQPAR